jgi:hypothetical protein
MPDNWFMSFVVGVLFQRFNTKSQCRSRQHLGRISLHSGVSQPEAFIRFSSLRQYQCKSYLIMVFGGIEGGQNTTHRVKFRCIVRMVTTTAVSYIPHPLTCCSCIWVCERSSLDPSGEFLRRRAGVLLPHCCRTATCCPDSCLPPPPPLVRRCCHASAIDLALVICYGRGHTWAFGTHAWARVTCMQQDVVPLPGDSWSFGCWSASILGWYGMASVLCARHACSCVCVPQTCVISIMSRGTRFSSGTFCRVQKVPVS